MFNPGNPQYRRGVFLASVYCTTLSGIIVSMCDFGKQEHVLSPFQRLVTKEIDKLFDITEQDIINISEKNKKDTSDEKK
jgi:hypothetical protein